ncbi:hypothetical protein UFOVP1483_17 [uncultured Caudovirales phage]|uniref:Uncharacterized protein n=1 Tax=uncultured Caudovirales phage TaxID=2100421 RepID=A0A6J5SM98_9CAUD|nr:hypothetical protein UFOVP1483_17 [uncultured Caudovirales phage]
MNAKELRDGNLVQKGNEIFEADFITIKMAHNYEPIPLTEDWLLKFGFEILYPIGKDAGNRESVHPVFPFKLLRSIHNSWRLEPCNFSDELRDRNGFGFCLHDISYVHQLQNLYFALTGKELTTTT